MGGDERLGYHSFIRGDLVRWTGKKDDKADMHDESADAKEMYEEIVFAVMFFSHRNQTRRYLITFDDKLSQFSINSWVGWTRVLKDAGGDVDDNENVCRATPELLVRMAKAWMSSHLRNVKTTDQLQKLSYLGPARAVAQEQKERREQDRLRKEQKRERDQKKADKAKGNNRDKPNNKEPNRKGDNDRTSKGGTDNSFPNPQPNSNQTQQADPQQAAAQQKNLKQVQTFLLKQFEEERKNLLSMNDRMLSELRAKLSETQAELHAERKKRKSPDQGCASSEAPAQKPPHTNPHVSACSLLPFSQDGRFSESLQQWTARPHLPHYSQSPPCNWLRRDIEELERKLVRLEAEQRVEREAQRFTHREGELELLRMDLRDLRRQFHSF